MRNILCKCLRFGLQGFQKAIDMVSVSRRVMAGNGERHHNSAVFFIESACLNGRKIVRLILIGVNRKMLK